MNESIQFQVASIDPALLTQLVGKAQQDESARVTSWVDQPLDGGFSGSAVHRFQGEATTTQGVRSWSLIRKQCSPANGSAEPTANNYWKREVLLYQSRLLDALPPSLIAPRCFLVEEGANQSHYLWLEDMGSQALTEQWPLAAYGMAARHLGQMNGRYLVDRALPIYHWLRRPDIRERIELAVAGIGQLPALSRHPHLGPLLPANHVERIEQLWAAREALLTRLDQLPQTFCHRDAFHRNLLVRHDPPSEAKTILMDWGSCGLGMLGEELVPLFAYTLKFVFADATCLPELDQTIFHGYMAGLRDVGWQGDERLVRFGFTALTALKDAVSETAIKLPNVARRIAALPPGEEPPRLLNPGGPKLLLAVQEYTLGLGEEACTLLNELQFNS